jgi:hypothetical protein
MRLSILRSERLWVPVGLILLALLFFGEYLTPPPGQYLGGWDVVSQLLQALRLARGEALAGRWPVWNPYLSSGMPLWANPQPGLLYPLNWMFFFVRWEQGISWFKAFHLIWIGLGCYVWARTQRLGAGGALVGALTLSYCGFVTVRVADGHPNFSAALAWLPWTMAALDHSLRKRTIRSAVIAGLPLAMSVYTGNPAGTFLVWTLAGLWTGIEIIWPSISAEPLRTRALVPVRQLVIAGAVGAGLSAAQLIPTAELIVRSIRNNGQGYEFASQYSLPLGHLISILVPNFFGEPVRLGYWGELGHTEFILYPGLLALLLAGAALRYGWEQRLVRASAALIGLGMLLALGPAGGLHPLLYRAFPLLGLARAPVRFAFWALFATATLAAWAVDHLQRHSDQRWGSPRSLAVLSGAPLALSVLAFSAYTLAPDGDARLYHIAAGLLQASFFFGLAGALLRWRPLLSGAMFVGLAATLTVADLWGYGVRELRTAPEGFDQTWQQAAALIGARDQSPPPRVLPWGFTIFQQNLAMDAGLASVLIYDPLVLSEYQTFLDSVPDPRATTYDLLSAEYLIIPADQTQWREEKSLTYLGQAGRYDVYRRNAALPRAWVAAQTRPVSDLSEALSVIHSPGFDAHQTALVGVNPDCPDGTGGAARITRFTPDAVTVETEGSGALVLSETWYPGWRATLDGRPAPVFPVDGVLRGVCVPDGAHVVAFRFDPPLVRWGLGVTAASLVIVLALLWRLKAEPAQRAASA